MDLSDYINKIIALKDESATEYKHHRCLAFIIACGLIADLIRAIVFMVSGKGLSGAGTFCIAVTGIQATVLTLTIALMALVSGQITSSYMGIGFNDFLLNIKPFFFTQRHILKSSIIMLVAAVFANILHCYGLVIALFVCTCKLIWISVSTIYGVFSGSERIEAEIKEYINTTWAMQSNHLDMSDAFVTDWDKIIVDQTADDYDEWKATFVTIFNYKFVASAGRKWLVDQYLILCRHLIGNEDTFVRGIDMIRSAYMTARTFLHNNHDSKIFEDEKIRFPLFAEISYSLRRIINTLPISLVERSGVGSLSDIVIYVDNLMWEIGLNDDKREIEWSSETENIAEFHRFLGQYISTHSDRNEEYWGSYLGNRAYWRRLFDESNRIRDTRYKRDQEFILGMLRSGYTDAIEQYFYKESVVKSTDYPDNNFHNSKDFFNLAMTTECYAYYLGLRETETLTGKDIQDSAMSLLKNTSVLFTNYIYNKALEDTVPGDKAGLFFDSDLIDTIYSRLKQWEIIGNYTKMVIMHEVVRDFVCFVIAIMCSQMNHWNPVSNIITDENIVSLFQAFCDNPHGAEAFMQITGILCKDNYDAQNVYDKFTGIIRDSYKVYALKESEISEKKSDQNVETQKEAISKSVIQYLHSQLSSIEHKNSSESCMIRIFQIHTLSDLELDYNIRGNFSYMANNFALELAGILEDDNKISDTTVTGKMSDEQKLQCFKDASDRIIIGSKYVLSPHTYSLWQEYTDAVEDRGTKKWSLRDASDIFMVIAKGKLSIDIRNVNVKVESEPIDRYQADFDPKTGLYTYEVSDGMKVKFTENELREYLGNKRRLLTIYAETGMQESEDLKVDVYEESRK